MFSPFFLWRCRSFAAICQVSMCVTHILSRTRIGAGSVKNWLWPQVISVSWLWHVTCQMVFRNEAHSFLPDGSLMQTSDSCTEAAWCSRGMVVWDKSDFHYLIMEKTAKPYSCRSLWLSARTLNSGLKPMLLPFLKIKLKVDKMCHPNSFNKLRNSRNQKCAVGIRNFGL